MISLDQAMRGAQRFAEQEVLPHLPTAQGIGAGIALTLIMDGNRDKLLALRDNAAVQMMGVMDADGNVDIDRLYNAARARFADKKLPVRIPLLGELKFDVSDVDKLYRYLQEG